MLGNYFQRTDRNETCRKNTVTARQERWCPRIRENPKGPCVVVWRAAYRPVESSARRLVKGENSLRFAIFIKTWMFVALWTNLFGLKAYIYYFGICLRKIKCFFKSISCIWLLSSFFICTHFQRIKRIQILSTSTMPTATTTAATTAKL